jgi:hypothetical protein
MRKMVCCATASLVLGKDLATKSQEFIIESETDPFPDVDELEEQLYKA